MTGGSPIPTQSLLTPPLGPLNDEDADRPRAVMVQGSPGARKSRSSLFPDEEARLSLPIWSIRHSHHLRTTAEHLPTIAQPSATGF